jgi:hypothetical protein
MIYFLFINKKENPKDEAIGVAIIEEGLQDCKQLRITIYELRFKRKQENRKSKICNRKSKAVL